MRRGRGDDGRAEQGNIAPALMLLMFAFVAVGTWFLDHAGAASLSADGDTAADAAALAGADSLRLGGGPGIGAVASMLATGELPPGTESAAVGAAADYAARNGGQLLDGRFEKVPGESAVRFTATVRTTRELDGRYPTRTAAAELRFSLTAPGQGSCMSQAEVDALIVEAGVADRHNGRSGLVECRNRDTENLDPEFKLAVLRAEAALKQITSPDTIILLYSAYRSAAHQAELYAEYQACLATQGSGCGPAAPPGQSLHNYGRAIDVENWEDLLDAIETTPDTGLCWPDIENDSVHFQDCRGRGGLPGLPSGNAYGLLEFDDVRLVPVATGAGT